MLSQHKRYRLIPVIVSIPLLLQNLDSSSLATALPTMARDLEINPLHLNLAITSYLMSLAVFLPLSSWLADRFGARTVFCAAIVVFGLGAMACGLTSSLGPLVIARVVQGMGGAMMLPIARMILLKTIPKTELIKAMVWFSVPATIGPILGPALGGFLVTYASWRWIFLMSVPISLAGVFLALRFIEDFREAEASKLDLVSFALLAFGLSGVVFGFETAGRGLLPTPVVVALFAVGAVSLGLYLVHARKSANPAIDLGLLNLQILRASVVGGMLIRTALSAQPFLMPLMLQIGFGMSAMKSGLITLAGAFGSLASRFFLPLTVRTLGFRRVLIGATIFLSALFLVYGQFGPGTPLAVMLGLLLLGGLGRAMLMVNLSTLGYSDVPPNKVSRATAIVSMGQQLSGSFGVSCGAALLHLTLVWRGADELGAGDFWPAFTILAIMPLFSLLYFWRLPPGAGSEVSGHGGKGGNPSS